MLQKFFLSLLFTLCLTVLFGQDKYRVFLSDKEGVSFDPYAYFEAKAIEKRLTQGIAIDDISDYPVKEEYINEIRNSSCEILGTSRWFNAVFCMATEDEINHIQSLPFVKRIEKGDETEANLAEYGDLDELYTDNQLQIGQIAVHQGQVFSDNGIDGSGVLIAIFDVGFKGANAIGSLSHVFEDNRIKDTYDFVRKETLNYAKGGIHGTNVFSCIAGITEEGPLGMGTGADFILARTERSIWELYSEEENWLMAAEWAAKKGADIINSSLGYTRKRYYQREMDGKTTFVTRAANFAASKGILVCNAAGNEGDDSWNTIGAPADSDSVLSVGGISSYTGYHTAWSSYGPTADKRLKPNVCSFGNVTVQDAMLGVHESQGTSFSSPLMAGFAACVAQMFPNKNNMDWFRLIQESGHLYPYFDYAHGYGLPQADFFYQKETEQEIETFEVEVESEMLYIKIKPLYTPSEDYLEELAEKNVFQMSEKELLDHYGNLTNDFLYYHIENPEGYISRYKVNRVNSEKGGSIYLGNLSGSTIRIFYKNYHYEYRVE